MARKNWSFQREKFCSDKMRVEYVNVCKLNAENLYVAFERWNILKFVEKEINGFARKGFYKFYNVQKNVSSDVCNLKKKLTYMENVRTYVIYVKN